MNIVHIPADDLDTPARFVTDYIKGQLASGKAVLWLVAGGSAIKVAVHTRELLGALNPTDILRVALTDERYGAVDHPDSNARQLVEAGFDMSGLTFYPTLKGEDIATTSQQYSETLNILAKDCDAIIALLGMGVDGHTAGLLPGNPLMDTADYAGQFDGFDFQRVTTTPTLLHHVDEAVLYAVGQSKWPIISQLATTDLPVAVLRQAKNLTVFSDYKETKL